MRKSILFGVFITLWGIGNAQNIDPITETEKTISDEESPLQKAVDYLLNNDKILNIKLDTRVDYQGKFNNEETEESTFRLQVLKLIFDGEIIPGVRYLVRQRLNKSQDASLARDNIGSATDFVFFELDAGKNWTFRIGKQPVLLGTFEIDYNPADIYLSTLINDDLDGYKTGINTAYKTGKHILNLQVVNSDSPQFASEKYKKKAFAGMFLWEGTIVNSIWKTRSGVGAFQHDGSKYYNWLTVGNKLNINQFTSEIDFYMGERNVSFNSLIPDQKLVKEQAISVNLMYNIGKWKPMLKGTWNKRRDQETESSLINEGIQAGVEYRPFTDPLLKALRFHAVYIYNNTNFNGIYNHREDINQNTVIVGMRWLFKVM